MEPTEPLMATEYAKLDELDGWYERPLLYLAGPIRGPYGLEHHDAILTHVMMARTWALEFWRRGFAVICPHMNTFMMDGALDVKAIMKGDLAMLYRCDAVFMTTGWRESDGALKEKLFAEQHGIPVFTALIDLMKWYCTWQENPPKKPEISLTPAGSGDILGPEDMDD